MTRSSAIVGAWRSVSRKYCCTNSRSASLIAKPRAAWNRSSSIRVRRVKSVSTSTSIGIDTCASSVAGVASDASRLSTVLMRYFLMRSQVGSSTLPTRTTTRAVRTTGRSPCVTSCTHSAAAAAAGSNCPGRGSIAKICASEKYGSASSYTVSTGGSAKTILRTCANSSSLSPSIS